MEKPQKTQKNKLDAAYRELKYLNKVSSQTDFGDKLGYSKSYFSQLMNNAEPITDILKDKCLDVFGIPKQWWDSSLDTPLVLPSKQTRTRPTTKSESVKQWFFEMKDYLYQITHDIAFSETDVANEIKRIRDELEYFELLKEKKKKSDT